MRKLFLLLCLIAVAFVGCNVSAAQHREAAKDYIGEAVPCTDPFVEMKYRDGSIGISTARCNKGRMMYVVYCDFDTITDCRIVHKYRI